MARDLLGPQKYQLDDDFESLLVGLACQKPSFWTRVGQYLDPEAMPNEDAATVLREVRMLVAASGKPPIAAAVKQRLVNKWNEGKWDKAKHERCVGLVELGFVPSQTLEENVVAEIVPLLKRRAKRQIMMVAADEHLKETGEIVETVFPTTTELIEKCNKLGADDVVKNDDPGIDIIGQSDLAFDEIEQLQLLERCPFGIPELDFILGGGFWRGCCCLLIARTGQGKSQTIGHVCCNALRDGRSVRLASLEDNRPLYNSRIVANVTGIPFEEVLVRPKPARAEFKRLVSRMPGSLIVKYFDPDTTTFEEIADWAEGTGDYDLMAVDYMDKLRSKYKKHDDSTYMSGRDVAQSMRKWAEDRDKFLITASQPRRITDRKRVLDTEDVAESMHKVRIPQLTITINYDKTDGSVIYGVAKNRMGRGNVETGPVYPDWARGRACVIPVSDDDI